MTDFERGAEAMREAAAKALEDRYGYGWGSFIATVRALPLPVQPPGSESREAKARVSLDAAIGLLEEIDPYKEGCPLKFNGKHSGGTIVSVLIHAKEARRALALDARPEEKK